MNGVALFRKPRKPDDLTSAQVEARTARIVAQVEIEATKIRSAADVLIRRIEEGEPRGA